MDQPLRGKSSLIAEVGDRNFFTSCTSAEDRMRRLLAEFIGAYGLKFALSAGAACLVTSGGGELGAWGIYLVGPCVGAIIAVGVAWVLRGPAKSQEARAAMGDPTAAE